MGLGGGPVLGHAELNGCQTKPPIQLGCMVVRMLVQAPSLVFDWGVVSKLGRENSSKENPA